VEETVDCELLKDVGQDVHCELLTLIYRLRVGGTDRKWRDCRM